MSRLFFVLITFITMCAGLNAQTLTKRQINLAVIASLEAQGDMTRLKDSLKKCLDDGVTINEIKEAMSHLYAYTGFPRSLNALGVLSNVLEERKSNGVYDDEGKAWTRPAVWDDASLALSQGTDIQTKLSGRPYNFEFCPQNDYYLKSHLFGDIFAGDLLSPSDREIVTVAALASMKGVTPQFEAHKRGAVNMGNTKEQIDELCAYLSAYGLSQCDNAADAVAGDWPKGVPNVNYAKYFIGDSHVALCSPKNLSAGDKNVFHASNVTFEPGCRNNWHIHHGARQILICVSGRGWYQEWGKEPIALKAGDVIEIPEEVKHWHGAQADSWFQHVATHVSMGGEESNEWLEPVTDEYYSKLK